MKVPFNICFFTWIIVVNKHYNLQICLLYCCCCSLIHFLLIWSLFFFISSYLPVTLLQCSHLRTCWNCASSNSRKSNPSESRSTIESNLKMTNSCNQQVFFFSFATYWISSFSIHHFTLYESRDLLLPATYVLIKLYKYAREKEIGIIYVHYNISLSFFFSLFLSL